MVTLSYKSAETTYSIAIHLRKDVISILVQL
jgi:hypothetical protein